MNTSTKSLRVVKPAQKPQRIGLMNPEFKYVPSASTDVRATFDRIRAQLKQGAK